MSGPDQATGQGLSGAVVAAQAGGEAAGAEAGRAGAEAQPVRLARPKPRRRAGIRSLQPAEAGGDDRTTDITGFLRKGVPEHLRNAALRKSWALDPAIRNYVNPALDYAYDWNTPGGVPAAASSAPAWMSRGWFRRSWAKRRPIPPLRSQSPKRSRHSRPSGRNDLPDEPLMISRNGARRSTEQAAAKRAGRFHAIDGG